MTRQEALTRVCANAPPMMPRPTTPTFAFAIPTLRRRLILAADLYRGSGGVQVPCGSGVWERPPFLPGNNPLSSRAAARRQEGRELNAYRHRGNRKDGRGHRAA